MSMDITEEWRAIPGYEGIYEVSNIGRVRSLDRIDIRGKRCPGRIRRLQNDPDGHRRVMLARDRVQKVAKVYRLVLLAFVGPPPEGTEALHRDGNPENDAVENLCWGTRSENMHDRVRHGTHHFAMKTHCPQGHPYDASNTYVNPLGSRECRSCGVAKQRKYRLKKMQEVV